MIYLVSQQILPPSEKFTKVSPQAALSILEPLRKVGIDTETRGFDPYTKDLLLVQMGCKKFQVVVDVTTVDINLFKTFLESDRTFIGWNIKFDIKFLLHKRIVLRNCYDGFLAEKLLWLGYPSGMHSMSLATASNYYCGITLDKSVRGQLIHSGLSEKIIVYAADDVKYLEDIMNKQLKELEAKNLLTAIEYENKSVNWLAYTEYCGVKLDVTKWRWKMVLDNHTVQVYRDALNDWVNRSVNGSKIAYHYLEISKIKPKDLEKARAKMKGTRHPSKDIIFKDRGIYEAYQVPINKKLSNKFLTLNRQGNLWEGFQESPDCQINWNSSDQVIPLFKALGFKLDVPDDETGGTKYSMEATVIEPQQDVSTIAFLYLQYKMATKVTSTYGQNVIDLINPVTKRLHTNFNQLGADTTRLSSGGKDKINKLEYLNFQNFPSDEETRACFVACKGFKWGSYDYSGQESRIIADVTNDPAMLELFNTGCGDVHSLVAKKAYPDIIGDTPIEEIKSKFHKIRNDVKSQVEFPINYGGDFNTIMNHTGKSKEEALTIYNNYMEGFPGIKNYQDTQRAFVMRYGAVILNPKTQHKAYIWDYDVLMGIQRRFSFDFWAARKPYKGKQQRDIPKAVRSQIIGRFASGEPLQEMVEDYFYTTGSGKSIKQHKYKVTLADVYNIPVTHFFRRKSACEKQAINYP